MMTGRGYPSESFIPIPVTPPQTGGDHPDDPVTATVIWHRLATVNEENAATILAVSGSPGVVFSKDFNSALLTADGEYVFLGRHILIHGGVIDLAVRYLLEEQAAGRLEIRPGDVFLTNDPWLASGHANDLVVVQPVFADSQCIAWTGNTVHHVDFGGRSAGSRDMDAQSAYQEAVLFPPLPVVAGGVFRADIAALLERQSRMPDYVALDLRAQVAGNGAAARRILEIAGQYGTAVLAGVMQRIIGHTAGQFAGQLAAIPDGTWRTAAYIDSAAADDDAVYRVGLELAKTGTRLTFRDHDSVGQLAAPLNATYAAWRSGILCAVLAQLGGAAPACLGGPLRHIDFGYAPGSVLNARFPAPVNRATGLGLSYAMGLGINVLAQMLAIDPARRGELLSVSGHEPVITPGLSGVRSTGRSFLRVLLDTEATGCSSSLRADGSAAGGSSANAGSNIPNVEEIEQSGGMLYLYRREEPDTGGAGRQRGGNAIGFGVIPYQAKDVRASVSGSGVAVPSFAGLFGGYPGACRHAALTREAGVWAAFSGGRACGGPGDLAGETVLLPGKCQEIPVGPDDVLTVVGGAGAGCGDPLERDPALVAADVTARAVSPAAARAIYGVAGSEQDGIWTADEQATAALRAGLIAGRGSAALPRLGPAGRPSLAGPHPAIGRQDGEFRCLACQTVLGPAAGPYRALLRRQPRAPSEVPGVGGRRNGPVQLEEYTCPGCGLLMDVRLATTASPPGEDEIRWDDPLAVRP